MINVHSDEHKYLMCLSFTNYNGSQVSLSYDSQNNCYRVHFNDSSRTGTSSTAQQFKELIQYCTHAVFRSRPESITADVDRVLADLQQQFPEYFI